MASFKAVNTGSSPADKHSGSKGRPSVQAVKRHGGANLNPPLAQHLHLDENPPVPVVTDKEPRGGQNVKTGASKRAPSSALPQKRKQSKANAFPLESPAIGALGIQSSSIDDAFRVSKPKRVRFEDQTSPQADPGLNEHHAPAIGDIAFPIATNNKLERFRYQSSLTSPTFEGVATPNANAAICDQQAPKSSSASIEGLDLLDLTDDDVAISDDDGIQPDASKDLPDVEAAWLDDLAAAMEEDDDEEFPSTAPSTSPYVQTTMCHHPSTQPSTPQRPVSPRRPVTPTRPKSSPLSPSTGIEVADLSSSNRIPALGSTLLSSLDPNTPRNPHHWSLTPPIVRPPFPSIVQARSPITGISSSCVLRTCFRIGEALNAGCRAARTGQNVLLELYARVTSSYREIEGAEETGKQHFQFADLFSDRGPVVQGYWENWKGVGLWEDDSAAFLRDDGEGEVDGFEDVDANTRGTEGAQKHEMQKEARLCRAMGRMTREGRQWIFVISCIWEAGWEDVEYVRGIVCA